MEEIYCIFLNRNCLNHVNCLLKYFNLAVTYYYFDLTQLITPFLLDNIVLIRSTVTPGTTKSLQQKYQNLRLVFNPEFLTERSANFDFINQTRYILGGDEEYTNKVADLYRWRFGDSIPVIETNYQNHAKI